TPSIQSLDTVGAGTARHRSASVRSLCPSWIRSFLTLCVLVTERRSEQRPRSREQREAQRIEEGEGDDNRGAGSAAAQRREPDEARKQHRAITSQTFEGARRQRYVEVQRHEQAVRRAESQPDDR